MAAQHLLVALVTVFLGSIAGQLFTPNCRDCSLNACLSVAKAEGGCDACICEGLLMPDCPQLNCTAPNCLEELQADGCLDCLCTEEVQNVCPPIPPCPSRCQIQLTNGCPLCTCPEEATERPCPLVTCPDSCTEVLGADGCPTCDCPPPEVVCPEMPACPLGCIDNHNEMGYESCIACNCTIIEELLDENQILPVEDIEELYDHVTEVELLAETIDPGLIDYPLDPLGQFDTSTADLPLDTTSIDFLPPDYLDQTVPSILDNIPPLAGRQPDPNSNPQSPNNNNQTPDVPNPNNQLPSNSQNPNHSPSSNQNPNQPALSNQNPNQPPSSNQNPNLPPSNNQTPNQPTPNNQNPNQLPVSNQNPNQSPSSNQNPNQPPPSNQNPNQPPSSNQNPNQPTPNNQNPSQTPSSNQNPNQLPPNSQVPDLGIPLPGQNPNDIVRRPNPNTQRPNPNTKRPNPQRPNTSQRPRPFNIPCGETSCPAGCVLCIQNDGCGRCLCGDDARVCPAVPACPVACITTGPGGCIQCSCSSPSNIPPNAGTLVPTLADLPIIPTLIAAAGGLDFNSAEDSSLLGPSPFPPQVTIVQGGPPPPPPFGSPMKHVQEPFNPFHHNAVNGQNPQRRPRPQSSPNPHHPGGNNPFLGGGQPPFSGQRPPQGGASTFQPSEGFLMIQSIPQHLLGESRLHRNRLG